MELLSDGQQRFQSNKQLDISNMKKKSTVFKYDYFLNYAKGFFADKTIISAVAGWNLLNNILLRELLNWINCIWFCH